MGDRIPAPVLDSSDLDKAPTHVVQGDKPADWEADYWTMYCGLVVRAFDDGTLVPPVEFYGPTEWQKATCEPCREAASCEVCRAIRGG